MVKNILPTPGFKKGSLTIVGVCFAIIVSTVLILQISIYQQHLDSLKSLNEIYDSKIRSQKNSHKKMAKYDLEFRPSLPKSDQD